MRPTTKADLRARMTRIVTSRLALVGGVVGGVLIALLHGITGAGFGEPGYERVGAYEGTPTWVVLAAGIVSTTVLGAWALRGVTAGQDAGRDVGRATLAAIANAPLWAATCALVAAASGAHAFGLSSLALVPVAAFGLTIVALVVTAPLGVVYGAVHAVALALLRHQLAEPAWRGLVRVRALGLAVAGLGLGVLKLLARIAPSETWPLFVVALAPLVALVVFDVGALVLVLARVARFVLRARTDPSMRVVPIELARVSSALAPIDGGATRAVVSARAATYRERPWAIALVR